MSADAVRQGLEIARSISADVVRVGGDSGGIEVEETGLVDHG
jgi:hypothetical protein